MSDEAFLSYNFKGELIDKFPFESDSKIKEKIKIANNAFCTHKATSLKERMEKLQKLAEIVEDNMEEDAKLMSTEMGKPYKESIEEIKISIAHCRFYARKLEEFLQTKELKVNNSKQKIYHEPLGAIYIITPFNFPHFQIFKPAVTSIAMGNSVLVRPSSSTPKCGLVIEKRFQDAGFGKVYQNIFSSLDQLEMIVSDKLIKGISFTGSAKAGSHIASVAGKYLKKSVMELGGSDPFIVLEDADLKKSVKSAVAGRFQDCGQVCCASKRFIIHEKLYDDFKERLIQETKSLNVGYPLEKDTDIGPLARKDLLENIERQVKMSVDQGGKILLGGKRINKPGYFYEPTIVEINSLSNILFQEETFGPVLPLFKVKTDLEAIQVANDTEYGLGGSVFGEEEHATKIARKIQTGMSYVNTITQTDPSIPFGGCKSSGYGRECGEEGLKEFSNLRLLWIN
ncbi:Aldehyde/histidinol dehydrogenase [Pseudocohnilembus persalinus]|uniref:Aldehyde/histidinol dehydrogenase n=1 Tax=Pseudocohnilembus persalinus TaxID=266149 RepID=A0A0V0QMS7_PSEPJ|nr:Aldehyde/histidinol dehydrogenase [Pseudocohnilembus persalinus]|eukprot:KRX03570.1 Aldehyde/histidinol dehydrogenase [Pseudocohnilembus persalinus]